MLAERTVVSQPTLLKSTNDQAVDSQKQFTLDEGYFDRLTHYLFRFPAKFHPPVVRKLIDEYSRPGDHILDPFCGSGKMLVEAAVAGRNAVGVDVDPVAAFVSRVKTHRYSPGSLKASRDLLSQNLAELRRLGGQHYVKGFTDLTQDELDAAVSDARLWVPDIPNICHWFRRYVILDMARIHWAIQDLQAPNTHKVFFRLCFASIVRATSNADPVPVSGLEVTSHMKRREAMGRVINPFALFERSVSKALTAIFEYRRKLDNTSTVSTKQADARYLSSRLRREFDAIITSPPYHNAVDYYRRHKLEMFWLGFTKTQEERLELMRNYVGRSTIPQKDLYPPDEHQLGILATAWESKMPKSSIGRANAFRHYVVSMKLAFNQFARLLKNDSPMIVVVGNSQWNGLAIPTGELFVELATPDLRLIDRFWYPVKNRYMSYSRRNGSSIDKEHVLVMQKANRDEERKPNSIFSAP